MCVSSALNLLFSSFLTIGGGWGALNFEAFLHALQKKKKKSQSLSDPICQLSFHIANDQNLATTNKTYLQSTNNNWREFYSYDN